jgi:micrococcal nuclease
MRRPGARIGLLPGVAAVIASIAVAAAAAPAAVNAKSDSLPVLTGRVIRIIDGDTLDVALSSGPIRVRMQGVDAPEQNQSGGRKAADWLRKRLAHQTVELEPVSQDRYGRMVAVINLSDRNINLELVKSGWAWAYRRYLRREDQPFCVAESQARQARRGVWATELPASAPWEFRATQGRGPRAATISSACGT